MHVDHLLRASVVFAPLFLVGALLGGALASRPAGRGKHIQLLEEVRDLLGEQLDLKLELLVLLPELRVAPLLICGRRWLRGDNKRSFGGTFELSLLLGEGLPFGSSFDALLVFHRGAVFFNKGRSQGVRNSCGIWALGLSLGVWLAFRAGRGRGVGFPRFLLLLLSLASFRFQLVRPRPWLLPVIGPV
eukprot:1555820-Amphidinium_carterae.2